MKNINYKTFIPAVVGAGVLVYEAYTGHVVSKEMETEIINGGLTVIGFALTVFGFIKDHKKGV
jgi:hypothetical protein